MRGIPATGVKTAQSGFHFSSCLNHSCILTPLSPPFLSPQAASDINSSTGPSPFCCYPTIKKMTGLIVSNGLFPLWVKCSSHQQMRWCFTTRPVMLQFALLHLEPQTWSLSSAKQRGNDLVPVCRPWYVHLSQQLSQGLCCCCMWKKVTCSRQRQYLCIKTHFEGTRKYAWGFSRQWWVCKVTTDTKQHDSQHVGVRHACTGKLCMMQTSTPL